MIVVNKDALFDLPWAEYRAMDAVNWSSLKQIGRSPAHYRHELTRAPPHDTDALKVGRAVHTAVFEPELFQQRFITWSGDRRAGKEWEQFKASNISRDILTLQQALEVTALQSAVRSAAVAQPYLVGGRREVTLRWKVEQPTLFGADGYSIDCKGRLDYLNGAGIIDLKTTRDASPEAFSAAAWRLGYLGQAAFYVDGYKAATGRTLSFTIVAVEKAPPYAVAVYSLEDDALEQGREQYRAYLDRLALCRSTGEWPGYQADRVQPLQLPRWARQDGEEDIADLDLVVGSGEQPSLE